MTFETQIEHFGTTAKLRLHGKIWDDCDAASAPGFFTECENKSAASHPFYRNKLNELMHHSSIEAVTVECEWKPDRLFHLGDRTRGCRPRPRQAESA